MIVIVNILFVSSNIPILFDIDIDFRYYMYPVVFSRISGVPGPPVYPVFGSLLPYMKTVSYRLPPVYFFYKSCTL